MGRMALSLSTASRTIITAIIVQKLEIRNASVMNSDTRTMRAHQYISFSENCNCLEFDAVELIKPNPDPVTTLRGNPKFTKLKML